MSGSDAVWPDGAREAVQTVVYHWVRDQWGDSVDIAGLILATLAPYLQQRTQRMAEALSDINELVPPPPVGVSQSMADRLRLMVAQRDAQREKSESLVAALRAEVARLREDRDAILREFCGWLSGDIPALHSVEVPDLADSLNRFLAARSKRSAKRFPQTPSGSAPGEGASDGGT